MSTKNLLIIGLPSSGKTTYLGALWYLLNHAELPLLLRLGRYPENRDYLGDLAKKWCQCIEIDRTGTDVLKEIQLNLINEEINLEIFAPDMSGETWESLWIDRSCTPATADLIRKADGIMLFLHAAKINPPIDIVNCNRMAGETIPTTGSTLAWDAKHSPQQVILVDILQSLAHQDLYKSGRKLVVLISAWDKVDCLGLTPESFLESYLPLLHQYLKFGKKYVNYEVYGISAQGGDLTSPEEKKRLTEENIPSNRIKVIHGNRGCTHDLTIPIMRLLQRQEL